MKRAGLGKKISGFWKKASRKKKTAVILIVLAAVALPGGIFWYKGRAARGQIKVSAEITGTAVKTGTVSNTIVGTGNLEADIGDSITIPSGIIIDEVKVESGDHVSKGDVLAVVDEVSVAQAVETVQKEIEELDEEINELKNETQQQEVTAKVSGRVKRIYAAAGEEANDCMVNYGALMLLSVDGKMAVDLEGLKGVSEGDTVTVTLSNGTQKEGTLESVDGSAGTVTLTDSGVGLDDNVTVLASDGSILGTGVTYIHQQLEITASGGIVEEVNVSEDQEVSSDTVLFTLEEDAETAEYQEKLASRKALAQSLQKLISMAETGAVTAASDGTISQVNISEGSQETSTGTSGENISAMSYSQTAAGDSRRSSVQLIALSSEGEELQEEEYDEGLEDEEVNQKETQIFFQITGSGTSTADQLVLAQPVLGEKPQNEITASDGSYTGSIVWNPQDEVFEAGISYRAMVSLQAAEGYIFAADSITGLQSGILSGLTVSEDGKSISFQITFPSLSEPEQENQDEQKENTNLSNGDGTDDGQDTMGSGEESEQNMSQAAADTEDVGNTGASVGSSGSTDSAASAQESQMDSQSSQAEDSAYGTEVTAFTLAADDTMVLSVSVDELDINSVAEKQTAEITLDAIEDKTFSGTVTKVSNTSSNSSGGTAKYTVEVTIPKDEQMKVGMNASATIVVEEREDVLTIPVSAVQERGGKSFVYTEKDEEGNLSGEQEVTTGLSDGSTVEITEGLSEGDTVYYESSGGGDSQEFDFGGDMPQMDQGNMEMPGGQGGMQMPQDSQGGMSMPGGGRGGQ